MTEEPNYWFRAKRYGYGWGAPSSWQGWIALVLFPILLAVGSIFVPPHTHKFGFVSMVVVLSGALYGICQAKGEPARWRWGDLDK